MKYSIILIDPPWTYSDRKLIRKDGKVPKAGMGAGNHYDCMTLNELARLPILDICDYPCAVFMWVTGPHLSSPWPVVAGWNTYAKFKKDQLRYCNKAFVWEKITVKGNVFPGRGHWGFHNTEDCLLFMRGSMGKPKKFISEEIREPQARGEDKKIIHSRKPACVREKIVQMFGDLPRIELFATEKIPGWDAIGLQLNGIDIRDFLTGKQGQIDFLREAM